MLTQPLTKRGSIILVAVIFVMAAFTALSMASRPAQAINYSFGVSSELVDVHILKDGSMDIDYTITFVNHGQMDGVDIGLPNRYYDKGSASAYIEVGGAQYAPRLIQKSPNVAIGLAIEFDAETQSAISGSGTEFTVGLHVNNPHMVYLNELKSGTVGIRFKATWFDPSYQSGNTEELRIRIYCPPGVTNATEVVYLQNRPWNNITTDLGTGLIYATWQHTNVNPSDQEGDTYDVGLGFPKQYVDKYYEHDTWEKINDLLFEAQGFCCALAPLACFAGVFVIIAVIVTYTKRKRAKDYFEPKMSVAGAGPRRDLTAVEAAVVLERPLEVVATMILFGLIKKGKVQVLSETSPQTIQKLSEVGDYPYETEYMAAIRSDNQVNRTMLRDGLINLIKATEKKMEGFDVNATKDYYKSICENAWAQVKGAKTPEEFSKGLSGQNEWMMLDKGYEKRMDGLHTGLVFLWVPVPHHHHAYGPSAASSGPSISPQQMAHNYVRSLRSSSSNMVSSIKGLASEVTSVTNPAPISSGHSGWGGGGGGGGGCACACACACAGGGR